MYQMGVEVPHGKGQFLGLSGPLKSIVAVYAKKNNSVLSDVAVKGSFNRQYQHAENGVIKCSIMARHAM